MPNLYEIVDLFLKGGIFVSIVSIILQIYRERERSKKETNERLCRVCNTLLIEVNDLDKWYKSPEYQLLKKRHYSAEYSENIVNTAPYNGIVNSGLITYLKKETQEKLNNYYFFASVHNNRMYSMAEIYNNKASSIDFNLIRDLGKITESEAWKLNETELSKYEKKMKELIPEIRKLLEDEITKYYHLWHHILYPHHLLILFVSSTTINSSTMPNAY